MARSGITSTICGVTGIVACAPAGSLTDSGVDAPGGLVVTPNTHKRFYIVISGDSSDLDPQALLDFPAVVLAPNPVS